jgi:hypothetical protein
MNTHPRTEPVDESWVAHLRDLSTGVVPPTSVNPHAMSRVAIRRTRTRRAVLTTGGGVMTVAAVAGAAFAIGSPTTAGVLLPGGSASETAESSMSVEEQRARRAEELQLANVEDAAKAALESAPDGWHVHELAGLVYALPPEIETSGPVQDEPGTTSDMWHDRRDADSPPFIWAVHVEPDGPRWLQQAPSDDAVEFDLPGAARATWQDSTAEAMGLPEGAEVPEGETGPVKVIIQPDDGAGHYIISMNLPAGSDEFVQEFLGALSLS